MPRIAERYAVTIPNIGLSDRINCQRPPISLVGINHGREVHQDLHQERDNVLEVAIEDRQRRQHHAHAQRGDERQWDQQAPARTTPQLGATP